MTEYKRLGKRTFKPSDLQSFAALSGDHNPLHMDPLAARRALEGGRVVHGMLLLLYGLDLLAGTRKKWQSLRLKCDFKKPVLMNEEAGYFLQEREDGSFKLATLVEGVTCLEATLTAEKTPEGTDAVSVPKGAEGKLDHLAVPMDWKDGNYLNFSGMVSNPKQPRLKKLFPSLCKALPLSQVGALSRLSYIVGMACPGLYSLFSSLEVQLGSSVAPAGVTAFTVTAYDERFHLLEMKLGGDLNGRMKAFRRPGPFEQPTMEVLKKAVVPGEFEKAKALVIGGSRGLGELTAKLICAGGGTVYLGYSKGKKEAEQIEAEIRKSSSGFCHPVHIDIFSLDAQNFKNLVGEVESLYYFPTPPIFKKKAGLFHSGHFREFIDFYVEKFFEVCEKVEKNSAKKIQVYFPSTSAIDQRPNGMTDYTMAKAAAEILIQDINRQFKKVRIFSSRLPRLGSDQTQSLLEAGREDNVGQFLPIIREMQNRSKG